VRVFKFNISKLLFLSVVFIFLFLVKSNVLAAENFSDTSLSAYPFVGIDPNYYIDFLNSSWVKIEVNQKVKISISFSQRSGINGTNCESYDSYIGIDGLWKKASCVSGYRGGIAEVKTNFNIGRDGKYGVGFYLKNKDGGLNYEGDAGWIGVYRPVAAGVSFLPIPTVYRVACCGESAKNITTVGYGGAEKIGGVFIPSGRLKFWSDPTCPKKVPISAYFGAVEIDSEWYNCGQARKTDSDACSIRGIKSVGGVDGRDYFDIRLISPIFVCENGYPGCASNAFFASTEGWLLYVKGERNVPAPSYEGRLTCNNKNGIRYCCKWVEGRRVCWIITVPPDKFYTPKSETREKKLDSLLKRLRKMKKIKRETAYVNLVRLLNKLGKVLN